MVGNTGTLMTMRIVRSKLRKRDDSSPASAVTIEAQQQHGLQSRSNSSDNNYYHENQDQQIFTTTSMTDDNGNNTSNNSVELESITFTRTSGGCNASNGWVFPPKAPSPNIYNCINHDALVTANERNGFKGFRKQFSGRFKRLVSKKPDPTSPIPPELKPQLKTIYVY